jgi:prepilin-type N-terminal cleavage/methylation domain-containing protein
MNGQKGFTLIELAVVILLIGVFFLLAIPKFENITDVNIKSASRRLGGTVRYLYSEAVFKKNVYKLLFDIDNGEYWIQVLDGNEFKIPADPFLRKKKLPEGVYFKDIITQRSAGKTQKGSGEFILFMPTGFVEPAVIHLEAQGGVDYTIATKPYTGGTIVLDRYADLFQK